MSGGLTPCRQLRPSSRREHVRASNSQMGWGNGKWGKKKIKKNSNYQTTHKSLYSTAAFKNSSGLTVLKRWTVKREPGKSLTHVVKIFVLAIVKIQSFKKHPHIIICPYLSLERKTKP